MSVIVCEELTKQFPNSAQLAVDRVNFRVEQGSLVVILGPSGCGKTTLLKMINRLYEPSSGRILVEGSEVHDLPVTELRRRIGYVIQQVGLFPHMTIEQNIAVVPQLLHWEKRRIDQRIDELLELVGLPQAYRQRHPRQLSGGEQQRIGLARALAADPAIMLMDEPFAAIDAIARARLQDELLDIQRKLHKTILFVTHDVEEALRLADQIVIMQTGKIVQYDSPLNIVTQPRNAFVQELVGTENMLRRLSLMNVKSALDLRKKRFAGKASPGELASQVAIRLDEDLRSALSCLLGSPVNSLAVIDAKGQPVDEVTFDDIRAAILDHRSEEAS